MTPEEYAIIGAKSIRAAYNGLPGKYIYISDVAEKSRLRNMLFKLSLDSMILNGECEVLKGHGLWAKNKKTYHYAGEEFHGMKLW